MMISKHIVTTPVTDFVNESFHEGRPSFHSLLSKFEASNNSVDGSFSVSVTSNRSVRKMLRQTSIRKQKGAGSNKAASSFASSISDLGFITEDDEDSEKKPEIIEEEDEYDENPTASTTDEIPVSGRGYDEAVVEPMMDDPNEQEPIFEDEVFENMYSLGIEVRAIEQKVQDLTV